LEEKALLAKTYGTEIGRQSASCCKLKGETRQAVSPEASDDAANENGSRAQLPFPIRVSSASAARP